MKNVQVTRTRSNLVCEEYRKVKLLVVEGDVSGQQGKVKFIHNWWASHYYWFGFFCISEEADQGKLSIRIHSREKKITNQSTGTENI